MTSDLACPGGRAWKAGIALKPYPTEFRDDVVRVARNREPGVTIEKIAKAFGVHPTTLQKWLRRADIDEGTKPGQSRSEAAEIRELRKRNRLLEQENEILRRAPAYVSQTNLPGKRFYLRRILKLTPKVAETAPVAAGLKSLKELADQLADSKWPFGTATRGFELETRYGGNLPPAFPIIDKFDDLTGVATSIKSTDLGAKTYQDPNRLRRLITGYIDKVAGFNGKDFSGKVIERGDITERELLLIVPRGATKEQQAVLAEMAEYAKQKGVTWTLEVSR